MSQTKSQKVRETKAAMVKRLLARKAGADLAALQEATGWQPHSVRAALSTLRKAGYSIEKAAAKSGDGRPTYRLTASPEGA
jgi:predicted ArsR family transcriptional regulator